MGATTVAVVVGVVLFNMALAAVLLTRSPDARHGYVRTLRSIRLWMWPAAAGYVFVLAAVVALLLDTFSPLRFGWWMVLGGRQCISSARPDVREPGGMGWHW